MKKLIFPLFLIAISMVACQKDESIGLSEAQQPVQTEARRTCASYEVLQEQLKSDPGLRQRRQAIEDFTQQFANQQNILVNGVITIPVVVNVLYKTTTENINIRQIQSQIDVLNADYNNTNSDRTKVPSAFTSRVGNIGIKFVLDTVFRKLTSKSSWSANDAMKKSSQGGINPTDPTRKLNMWVCNLGSTLLGYAQFPGGSSSTDGVVINYNAFGSKAIYASGVYQTPYDLGRTATHEVGHWMNLYHIWGDDGNKCTGSDQVGDTPNQGSQNYGCPTFPHVTCSNGPSGDMFMNYMDYTDDGCMYMFSAGQATRAKAVFQSGGARYLIGQ